MTGDKAKAYLHDYTKKYRPIVRQIMKQEAVEASKIGKLPSEMVDNFAKMFEGGKGLRGALIVLGYRMAGGTDLEEITKTSVFYEIFHSGILAQDDFMDESDTRRGIQTMHRLYKDLADTMKIRGDHTRYGYSVATCIGDYSFYLSWKTLMRGNFPPENLIETSKIYSDYMIRLVHGQFLDISPTSEGYLEKDWVLKVIKYKSSEYSVQAPLLMGASLAGLSDEKVKQAIVSYSDCLGWAFQLQDDYLGMFGDPKKTGKPVGDDMREGKHTLLMQYLGEHGTKEQKEFKDKMLGNENTTEQDVEKMRQVLIESGSLENLQQSMRNYVSEGKNHIPQMTTDKELSEIFESMLEFMLERIT